MFDPRTIFLVPMHWWNETAVGVDMRASSVLIALVQSVHLLGLTMFAGTLLLVNLRMMGIGFVRQPLDKMARELEPWTRLGIAISLASGILMLSSEARKCYEASFFWLKMILLVTALGFHFTVRRRWVRTDIHMPSSGTRGVACISLLLWLGVAISGKMIGIYGDDLRTEKDPFALAAK